MTLKEKLNEDLMTARKNGQADTLATLSLLVSEIQGAEKQKNAKNFDDDVVLQSFLTKQVKTRRDTVKEYEKNGSPKALERKAREEREIKLIETYLPAGLEESEVVAIIDEVVSSLEVVNMGAVMKQVQAKVQGRFDGKRISELVRERIA